MKQDDNAERNREVYDALYHGVDLDALVANARNGRSFLENARVTHMSWIGMYHDRLHDRLAGKDVLELGAGDGQNAMIMAALGARVLAVDISPVSAEIVNEAARRLGLEYRLVGVAGDFPEMDLGGRTFDIVVGKAFLHHLTHEQEEAYFRRSAEVLRETGEARFFEPATNSELLDSIRWMVPVPGRPSVLQKRAFAAWKADDPHPERSNSSEHYREVGEQYFGEVEITPLGGLHRLHRLLPNGRMNHAFRRAAHRVDQSLPLAVQRAIARSQTIHCRHPARPAPPSGL